MPVRHIGSPADLAAIMSEANGRLVVVDHTATWVRCAMFRGVELIQAVSAVQGPLPAAALS